MPQTSLCGKRGAEPQTHPEKVSEALMLLQALKTSSVVESAEPGVPERGSI